MSRRRGDQVVALDLADDEGNRDNFLDDDCGRNALQLASRGSAIIATLQRLAAHIPAEFASPRGTIYERLIFDYSYFKAQDATEKSIADSMELLMLDKEFYNTHMELLERFMALFRSIHGYALELNRYIREIQDGQYVAQTLDSVLDSLEGRQLLCELYQAYGVMLLLLDHKIGGVVRERLVVSYIRYRGFGEAHTVEVAELCRATEREEQNPNCNVGSSSSPPSSSSSTYAAPNTTRFFERIPVQKGVVGRLLACLRSDDVYRMSSHYPKPEHRSAAMALQGGLVYVLLYFCGDILAGQLPVMKELVEKHFADNWVVHYYAGYTANLSVAWAVFPAAQQALQRSLEEPNLVYHLQVMRTMLSRSTERVAAVLQEGVLTESYVLDNVHAALLPIITEANVALRWFVLHGVCAAAPNRAGGAWTASSASSPTLSPVAAAATTTSVPLRDKSNGVTVLGAAAAQSVRAAFDDDELLTLLLSTAQLEYYVASRVSVLLQEKSTRWSTAKRQAVSRTKKLSQFFSVNNKLDTSVQDGELELWFREVAARISGLHVKHHHVNGTRRKLQRLIAALENIQDFDQVSQQLQVLQYVREVCGDLHQMLRYMNVERRVLARLATVADTTYAWETFSAHGYLVRELQARIRLQPVVAAQMRALFAKLSSLLHLPCMRIDQGIAVGCATADRKLERTLDYTATFYSEEVVTFLRSVLQVIPTSIFEVLHKVMYLLTHALHECPSKLQREEWRRWSQLETREQLAAYTADIARYAAGLLAMEETMVGVVRVNPQRLLEDGVRKELVEHITRELHAGIWFDAAKPSATEQIDKELAQLGARLRGVRNSFEYIQDFVNVHGLQIWTEEFQRIVCFTLQMESNAFWHKKVYAWNSPYQSTSIAIPYFLPNHPKDAYSFLGHLVQHLVYLTDPTESIYLPAYGAWFTRRRLCESVGPRLFARVAEAIDCVGLANLDKLLSLHIAKDTQLVLQRLTEAVVQGGLACRTLLQEVWGRCTPVGATPDAELYAKGYDQLAALLTSSQAAQEMPIVLMRIGRMVLMRELIAHQLRLDSTQDSNALVACLQAVNASLLTTVETGVSAHTFRYDSLMAADTRTEETDRKHKQSQRELTVPAELLREMATLLDAVGLSDPTATVYEVTDNDAGVLQGDHGGAVAPRTSSPLAQAPPHKDTKLPVTVSLPLFVLPLCVTLLTTVEHVTYSERFDSCIPAEKHDDVDPTVFAVGTASLLQQFPLEATRLVMQLLAQARRVSVVLATRGKGKAPLSLVARCAAPLPMWMDVLRQYTRRYNEQEWTRLVARGHLEQYLKAPQSTAMAAAFVSGMRAS